MRICKIDVSNNVYGMGGFAPPTANSFSTQQSASGPIVSSASTLLSGVNTASTTSVSASNTSAPAGNGNNGAYQETVALGPLAAGCVVGAVGSGLAHAAQNRGNVGLTDTAVAAGFGCLAGTSAAVGGAIATAYSIAAGVAGAVGSQAALNAGDGFRGDGTRDTQGSTAGNGDATGMGGYGTDASGLGTY